MVVMATTSGSARERLQRARAAALTKVGRAQPEEPEETFVCSVCHRDMPVSERSRIALGRCRACT